MVPHNPQPCEPLLELLTMGTGCLEKADLLRRTVKQKGAHLRSRNGEIKDSFNLDPVRAECSPVLGLLATEEDGEAGKVMT